MEKEINLFVKEFEEEIKKCKDEEDNLRKITGEYLKAILNHKKTYGKRIELFVKVRNDKITEINKELNKYVPKLNELEYKLNEIIDNYCMTNKHEYILISSYETDMPYYKKEKTFCNTYKCIYCGHEVTREEKDGIYIVKQFERKLPKEIGYQDTNKFSLEYVQNTYNEYLILNKYVNYLNYLKSKICDLFGHEICCKYNKEYHFCKCCGKIMNKDISRLMFDSPYTYKVMTRTYFRDINYITYPNKDIELSLPTFEEYLEELEEKNTQKLVMKKDF